MWHCHSKLIGKVAVGLGALCLLFSTQVNAVRLGKQVLLTDGDRVSKVVQHWGKPDKKGHSEETCAKVLALKKTVCSTRRWVWYREGMYHRFQVAGSKVIKHDWTRFENRIWDEF